MSRLGFLKKRSNKLLLKPDQTVDKNNLWEGKTKGV
jgi:hypothetical protein